jgi:glutaredoxin 3
VPHQWWWKANREGLRYESAKEPRHEVEEISSEHKVMVFDKSYCGYSRVTKNLLQQQTIKHKVVELDHHGNGKTMQQYLAARTGQRNVPQTFRKGTFIEGQQYGRQLRFAVPYRGRQVGKGAWLD